MLRNVDWYLLISVSGQHIGPIFKGSMPKPCINYYHVKLKVAAAQSVVYSYLKLLCYIVLSKNIHLFMSFVYWHISLLHHTYNRELILNWHRQKVFLVSKCLLWSWGLPSLLFSWYWGFFLGGEVAELRLTAHLHPVLRFRSSPSCTVIVCPGTMA